MLERLQAEVRIEEGDSVALAGKVRSGALHMSLGFQDAAQPRREHEGLERRDLLRETFLVALAPGHRLAGRPGSSSPSWPGTVVGGRPPTA